MVNKHRGHVSDLPCPIQVLGCLWKLINIIAYDQLCKIKIQHKADGILNNRHSCYL